MVELDTVNIMIDVRFILGANGYFLCIYIKYNINININIG